MIRPAESLYHCGASGARCSVSSMWLAILVTPARMNASGSFVNLERLGVTCAAFKLSEISSIACGIGCLAA